MNEPIDIIDIRLIEGRQRDNANYSPFIAGLASFEGFGPLWRNEGQNKGGLKTANTEKERIMKTKLLLAAGK